MYPAYGQAWLERVLACPVAMHENAAHGIAREAERCSLVDRLAEIDCPVLVIRGALEGSLLNDDMCKVYTQHLRNCRITVLPEAAHDLLQPDASAFINTVEDFLTTNKKGAA